MTAVAWWYGPWIGHMVPGFWLWQGAAAVSWIWYRWKTRAPQPLARPAPRPERGAAKAA